MGGCLGCLLFVVFLPCWSVHLRFFHSPSLTSTLTQSQDVITCIIRRFPTRMVYLHCISCLGYTILVGNPQMTTYLWLNSHMHKNHTNVMTPRGLAGKQRRTRKSTCLYAVSRHCLRWLVVWLLGSLFVCTMSSFDFIFMRFNWLF